MATFSANFPELMETRQKTIFFRNYTMDELLFPRLISRHTSTKSHEDRIRYAGLGTFQAKPEGTPIAFDDMVEGTRRRVVHSTFALGNRATWEAMRDDQWDVLDKAPADMGDSARDHQERLAWDLINDAYSGTRNLGLDNLALFSASHTQLRPGAAVQSNILSPPVELSEEGLESMMTLARLTQNEEGRYSAIRATKLVFHPNQQHTVYKLLNTEYKVSSSDNDKSAVYTSQSGITALEPTGIPYMTSTTAWSLHVGPGKNSLQWNDREKLFFDRANDAMTFDQLYYGAYRASIMFSEWRGNFGSNFA